MLSYDLNDFVKQISTYSYIIAEADIVSQRCLYIFSEKINVSAYFCDYFHYIHKSTVCKTFPENCLRMPGNIKNP